MNTGSRKKRKKRLAIFLAKSYFWFTILMLLAFVGIYGAYDFWMRRAAPMPDPVFYLEQAMEMGDEGFRSLHQEKFLGKGAKVTVLDQEGNLVFSSYPGERTSYSRRLLECIPGLQGDSWFRGAALPEDSQGERYLITRIQYDESGWAQVTGYLLLNKELQVVEGNLFPGRSFFSPEEFQYLQGKDSSGREIYRQEYKNGDGENRILLLHFFQPGNEEYQKVYEEGSRLWWLMLPAYLLIVSYSIFRLSKKTKKLLNPFLSGIGKMAEGKQSGLETYEGPEEFKAIARQLVSMETQLKESEKERQRLDQEKRKFLTDISHDLKTPATVIRGYAEAMRDGLVPEEQKGAVWETIIRKAQQVSTLLISFHEYSKLEHPQMPVSLVSADLGELVRDYFAGRYQELELKGFLPEADIPEEPMYAMVDHRLMVRVLDNLINNAVSYNPPGTRILVAVKREGEMIRLLVADSGCGIPKEMQETLFQPFVTGDEARTGSHGSGLGLAIVKKIVELHGGNITAAEDPPEGFKTEFRILLPAENRRFTVSSEQEWEK